MGERLGALSNFIGCRVRVIACPGKYHAEVLGRQGAVKGQYQSSVAVKLDDLSNPKSDKGLFYFDAYQLELVKTGADREEYEEDKTMEKIENYLNVAIIQFLDDDNVIPRTYEYANFEPGLACGDLCVVKSAHHGMGLAEVVDIKPNTANALQREIVARVDDTNYKNRVEQREKAAELKAKMKERAKQLQDLSLYQLLAKDDTEMAKLLQDYLSIKNA